MWLFYSLCSWMSRPKEIRTQCHFTKLSCLTQPQPCFLFPPPNIYIYLITLDPDWLWVTTGEESGQWSWNLKQGWPSSVSWLLVADVLSIHPNLYFLISLVAVTIPEVFIEQCVRMVVLEQGCLCGCSGQWEGASFSGDNWYPEGATRALTLAHCVALNRLCPMWAQSQYLSLTLFFFFLPKPTGKYLFLLHVLSVFVLRFRALLLLMFSLFQQFWGYCSFFNVQTHCLSVLPVCQILFSFSLPWT